VPSPPSHGRFRIETPGGRPGAIAIVACFPAEPDSWLRATGLGPLDVGESRLRDLLGVDEGLAIRWTEGRIDLTPHGGPAVVRALARALEATGLVHADRLDPREAYPEAETQIEALMLAALAEAPSPKAIDLLLDQPRRWSAAGTPGMPDTADPALDRLLVPPTVALLGPPNVGKSSLLNALAGRDVSIVEDASSTTRDHVGVALVVDGLAVRALDLPGLMAAEREPDRRAHELAHRALTDADLVLLVGDAGSPPPEPSAAKGTPTLTVATRTDLGEPGFRPDARVALVGPQAPIGLECVGGEIGLAGAIRRALVPDAALADPRPWRFWGEDT